MKVFNVVGTRPNFVKIASLLDEMRKCEDVEPLLVHTGQHYDREMSADFLRALGIPAPDFELSARGIVPGTRKEEVQRALTAIMRTARPDVVLVVGDVDSTVAGALAAHHLDIPVAHVEAGLRSFDPSMPEEVNRIVTDSVSSLLFASEESALTNLLAEGRPANRIFLTGNVMIDTLRRFQPACRESTVLARLDLLNSGGAARKYVLATLHRPGTVDDPAILGRVWTALEEIAASTPVVFAAHPRTRSRLQQAGVTAQEKCADGDRTIRVIPPQPYIDFLHLESEAALVMTDSGGVQEETTALGVPCLTLRNNTERPVTLTHGTNQLVGLEPGRIVHAGREILCAPPLPRRIPPLWDGHAAERIVRVLRSRFGSPRKIPPNFHSLAISPPKDLDRNTSRLAR